jgi:hypothetical protein
VAEGGLRLTVTDTRYSVLTPEIEGTLLRKLGSVRGFVRVQVLFKSVKENIESLEARENLTRVLNLVAKLTLETTYLLGDPKLHNNHRVSIKVTARIRHCAKAVLNSELV